MVEFCEGLFGAGFSFVVCCPDLVCQGLCLVCVCFCWLVVGGGCP